MANISITSVCNRHCEFCFAGPTRNGIDPVAHMPLHRFEEALDFLGRSGISEARLLGGEPTLHPDFDRVVDMVAAAVMLQAWLDGRSARS